MLVGVKIELLNKVRVHKIRGYRHDLNNLIVLKVNYKAPVTPQANGIIEI